MRTIYFVFLWMSLSSFLEAQTSKKMWLVGGSTAGIDFRFDKDAVYTFQPNVGYFLADNFAIGTTLGFKYTRIKNSPSTIRYAFEPFVRYYMNKAGKLRYFGQLQGGLSIESYSNFGLTDTRVLLGPGINYFVSDRVALETFLAAQYQTESVHGLNLYTSSFGLLFSVGVQVFLGNSNKPQAN